MSGGVAYRVRHETTYEYASDVVHAHQLLHLVPRPAPYQECREHTMTITPRHSRARSEVDAFGNLVTRVEFDRPHRRLEVVSEMEVEVYARPPFAAGDSLPWEDAAAALDYCGVGPAREQLEASRFRHESPHVRVKRVFNEFAEACFPAGRPVLAAAAALMSRIHDELAYAPGETTIATPLVDVLENRRGVCQDFAHLMIACLRSRGLAARYVSGYVRQLPVEPPGPAEPAGAGRPAGREVALVGGGASHAWIAVHAPPFGWVELDPTNDKFVGTEHVAVAYGRDFGDVSPLRGVILGGGRHTLAVNVSVERLAGA